MTLAVGNYPEICDCAGILNTNKERSEMSRRRPPKSNEELREFKTKSASTTETVNRPTLEDVAAMSGRSMITVIRALNHPHMVSAKTREEIQHAVRKTGYVPNLTARSMTRKRTDLVGLTVPSVNNSFWASVAQGVFDSLRDSPYQMMIGSLQDAADGSESQESLVRMFLGRQPDALLLSAFGANKQTRKLLKNSGIPVVELVNIPRSPLDMAVGTSNRLAMKEITKLIIEKGHRDIGFLGGAYRGNELFDDRVMGFKDALFESGIEFKNEMVVDAPVPITLQSAGLAFASHIARNPSITAVVCGGDYLAHAAIFWCAENGIKVPEQISIVGIGDMEISRHIVPALTTVRIDGHAVGAKAGAMVLRRLRGERVGSLVEDVGFEIIARESG